MEKEFVPFYLAVRLKELGFDEECLGYYRSPTNRIIYGFELHNTPEHVLTVKAPLWQQSFDWFRERYNLDSYVRKITYRKWKLEINYILQNDSKEEWEKYKKFQDYKDTQKEARRACLEKLIELCKKK